MSEFYRAIAMTQASRWTNTHCQLLAAELRMRQGRLGHPAETLSVAPAALHAAHTVSLEAPLYPHLKRWIAVHGQSVELRRRHLLRRSRCSARTQILWSRIGGAELLTT